MIPIARGSGTIHRHSAGLAPVVTLGTADRRFRAYPAYKESSVEWLGRIPAHWDVAPVYARYEVALGKMLDQKRITGNAPGRYLANVNVQWDRTVTEDLPEMDFGPLERERYRLREGDLLVCEGGEVGRTAIWRGELAECFYQKAVHRVRPLSEREVPRFFFYVMSSLANRGVFVAGGNPNTIDHLTAVQLKHYHFAFPPSAEQRTIVAFLDRETAKIDALVVKKEQLIELLLEKRTALITRAVTKGFDANAPMKDSGVEWLGQIPAHWELKRLKNCVRYLKSGGTPASDNFDYWSDDDSGTLWVSIADMTRSFNIVDTEKRVTERGLRSKNLPILPAGTLLYSMYASLGKVAMLGVDAVVNQAILGLVTREDLVRRDFLRWWLTFMQGHVERLSSSNTQDNLNAEAVRNMPVCLPESEEQTRIAAFLDRETAKLDGLAEGIREAIERLKELRTALISAAVTGKIDVREAAAA